MIPIALTIAGSDPSGGAGIQADLKTFHQFHVYGEAVITLITVQNTERVSRVEVLSAGLVVAQLQAVLEDIPPHAAKTGALGNAEVIEAIAAEAARFNFPLVVDPVMISKHGARLVADDAIGAMRTRLLPRASLLTPNLHEAAVLANRRVERLEDMKDAARALHDLGAEAVLVKGGHLKGDAADVLYYRGEFTEYRRQRVDTRHTHGTGCTYSAALTAHLAAGSTLPDAVDSAKTYITRAIGTNPELGRGNGPVNHWAGFNTA